MKRKQLGLFFLFLSILSYCHECTISLIDYERQFCKLDALIPEPVYIQEINICGSLGQATGLVTDLVIPGILTSQELKKIVFYAAQSGRYQTISISICQDKLSITLIPHTLFERCSVKGLHHNTESIKHHYLIKPGMVFDQQLQMQAISNLETQYKQKGFLEATVMDQLVPNHDQKTVSVELELHTGKAIQVHSTVTCDAANLDGILINGNQSFSTQELQKLLLLYGNALEDISSETMSECIAQWYHAHGYKNAIVNTQKKSNSILITIDEGSKQNSTVSSIDANLLYEKPSMFGKTILQKTSRVPDEYILRELSYAIGQPYTCSDVADTVDRLSKLQIFDRVHLYPIQNPFSPHEYTMMLQVRDDQPRELRMRGGFSLQQMSKEFQFKNVQYAAGGTFLIKNPSNHADLFFVDADYTYGEQILSLNYQCPWIFDYPHDARFQVYAMQYLQPGLRHNHKNIYSFTQQGVLMGLRYQNKNWDTQINYGIEWMETKLKKCQDYPLFCKELTRALNFSPVLLDQKIPYIFTEPSIVSDTLDDQLNPREGALTLFTAKAMIPCRHLPFNASFLKLLIDHAYFVPFNYAILGTRIRVGHIFFKHFSQIMPAERFYLGGANSIRSYETDLCPPLGVIFDDADQLRFVPQGAQSMVNVNVELRIPAKRNLWFALFQDLGALSNTKFADIKMRHILAGTGAGIRIKTPIGPLRFDFAFKWHRPDQTIAPYCWFLSFGNAF